ncbi:hypothetical protein Tco_0091775 [Tanacetum coccineum]
MEIQLEPTSNKLLVAESDSLPHAHTHTQTTKTYYKHQDSRIKKAQELKTKTSAYSDIKDNSLETKLRGRLLKSSQEDANYEHVGQDTRSQDVLDDDISLTFLIDLGYKGPLNRHTNMFVDHMHQPWRTLVVIINKCLSEKTASNNKLRKSIIDIMWGMFNRENVDYPELIWEDFAYQIVYRKEKRPRRLPIPDVMLTDAMIKYSTNQIPPKKSRGKGSKGKKTTEESQETIDVSEESELELEPAKKKTSSKRGVKKKVTLSTDDNIISDDPNAALELAKSICNTPKLGRSGIRVSGACYFIDQ